MLIGNFGLAAATVAPANGDKEDGRLRNDSFL